MFEWLFGRRKEVEELKNEVKQSFEKVKNDINDLSKWRKFKELKKDLENS